MSEENKTKTSFLTDGKGKRSMMRAMSFVALLLAGWFGHITIQNESDVGIYVTTAFITAAFAPKAFQKWIEEYDKNKPE